jgi:D-psicose/D-tagatose/L-ribulose 3-epimerase
MKIGCCTNMLAAQPDGTGIEYIEKLKEIGYDYIELPLAQIAELSGGEFSVLKLRVNTTGLRCEVCNNFFPSQIRLTGSEVNYQIIESYLEAALERACQLGVKIIVFGSSGAKNVPEGFPVDRAWEQLVVLLRYISDKINTCGITIAIEPLNKLESNIINTSEEGLRLAKEVDKENIKLLVDYYHMAAEKEDVKCLLNAGDFVRHIHFASPALRVFPSETDIDDYTPFLNGLKEIGYNDRISVEAYTKDFCKDSKKALALLKTLTY